jgi:hypothetical protein
VNDGYAQQLWLSNKFDQSDQLKNIRINACTDGSDVIDDHSRTIEMHITKSKGVIGRSMEEYRMHQQ